MKVFTIELKRRQLVKLFMGLAGLSYAFRIVLGIINEPSFFGYVSTDGYTEFTVVMLIASAVLLLSEMRDKYVWRGT